jgi:GTP:adenosylcobinamide-phosphate guanylyltransferase
MVNALILAGDRNESGKPKALLQIAKKYMIEYLIQSLKDSGCVSNIYVVGDEILHQAIGHEVNGIIKPESSIISNLKKGIETIGDYNTPVIICTSDIPMVSGEAILDFVEKSTSSGLDFIYPIIDKKLNDEKYPEVKRTYVKIKEGTFTGGNIIYMNPKIVGKVTNKAELLIKYRKKPFKMGQVLGFMFLIKLLFGKVSIPSARKKVDKMFGIKADALLTQYPEIGNDVDKPSDLEFVSKYLANPELNDDSMASF